MKRTIERITSTAILSVAFMLSATSAWAAAPEPTAVWEAGQFADVANLHNGYSITLPTGAKIENDKIVLSGSESTGALIDVASVNNNATAVSVLIKYSGVSAPSKNCVFVSTYVTANNGSYDMCAISKGASLSLQGTYDDATNSGNYWAFANPAPALGASGYFLFTYNSSSGTAGYSGSTIDSLTGGKNTDLKAGSRKISKVSLGGPTGMPDNTFPTWDSGMTIEAVALFVGQELTLASAKEYGFPSEDPTADYDYAATISANTTLSEIITWTKGTGTPGANSKVYIASENNAVLTVSGSLCLNRLKVVGGSITLADGASVTSTQIDGAGINIAASTEVTISDSDILSKIICNGVLNTSGTTSLQGENEFTATSTLNVGGTKTSLNAGDRKLSGTINVLAYAELENTRDSDALNYSSSANVNITGTLNMGSTRWTIGGPNTITLHEGAVVTCANNNGNGALNWNIGNSAPSMSVDGNATLSARIKIISTATLTIDVANGKTLAIETGGFLSNGLGPVKKTGLGVISNTAATFNVSTLTVSQGKFISTEFPSGTVSIADGATFTLKNKAWTEQPGRFSGTGTLELRSESASCAHTVTGVTFPGIVKLSNVNMHYTGGAPYYQNNIAPTSADMFAENIRPEFILDSDLTHLGAGYYRNNAEHPLRIKNLSGSGEFRGQWGSGEYKYVVETLQERNTTYDGTLGCDASGSSPRCVSLSVIGNNPSEIHSLTITQAINGNDDIGCQTSTLTVADDAKVVFAPNGKWGYGQVVVTDGGWLESENTASIARALSLNSGAHLVIHQNVPITAGTITIPADGTVYVDMSAFGLAEGSSATIISATTLTGGANVGNLESTSGYYTFAVDPQNNNAIKATNMGTCVWNGDSWNKADPSLYSDVTVNVAAGGTTLTLDDDYSFDSITLSGSSSSLTIDANGHTLTVGDIVVPNGVTLVASSALTVTGSISGGGNLTVPNGVTFTCAEGETWTIGNSANVKTINTGVLTVQSGGRLIVNGRINIENMYDVGTGVETVIVENGGALEVTSTGTLYQYPNYWSTFRIRGECIVAGSLTNYGDLSVESTGALSVSGTQEFSIVYDFFDKGTITFDGRIKYLTTTGRKILVKDSGKIVFAPTDSYVGVSISQWMTTGVDYGTTTPTMYFDVTNLDTKPTGTSATTLVTTSTSLTLGADSLTGCSADYYVKQNATTGAVTLQLYAAKDDAGGYYRDASSALWAILENHALTLTILDGTEDVWTTDALSPYGLERSGTSVYYVAARIGSAPYNSVQGAVDAAENGQTITLATSLKEAITLNNKSIVFDEGSYTFSGSFTGNGTLVLPEGTLLKSADASMWAEGWTGTVWVKGINNICGVATSGSTLFEPNKYGREGSVLKLSGIKGWILGAVNPGVTINPTIEIEDATYGYGLWLSDGYGYNGGNSTKNYTILKGLKGTGTLIGNGNGGNVLLQVEGWNDFAGTLTLTNKVVVFGSTLPEEQAHIEGGGYILVKSGESVEVPAGKTWTVGNGVIVNGNLSLGTGAAIANTTPANTWVKRGTGTITLNAPSDLPATPASDWAGTVVLPSFTAGSGHDLNKYGVEGSKVQLTGITSGWLDMGTSTINPEIVLAGDVTLTDSSNRTWTFKKVSGTGNLSLTPGTYDYQITIIINDLASTVGTISNNMGSGTTWTIDKISFPAETSLPAGTKILSTGGTGPVVVSGVTVGGVATPIPIKYKEDGVYIGYGTTFTVY